MRQLTWPRSRGGRSEAHRWMRPLPGLMAREAVTRDMVDRAELSGGGPGLEKDGSGFSDCSEGGRHREREAMSRRDSENWERTRSRRSAESRL